MYDKKLNWEPEIKSSLYTNSILLLLHTMIDSHWEYLPVLNKCLSISMRDILSSYKIFIRQS